LRDFFFFTLIFLKSAACFSNSAGLKMPLQATSPLEKTRNFEEKSDPKVNNSLGSRKQGKESSCRFWETNEQL
jgi:hypothetical protein